MARRLIPIVLLLVLAGGAWLFLSSKDKAGDLPLASSSANSGNTALSATSAGNKTGSAASTNESGVQLGTDTEDEQVDNRPASEIYQNANDALAAVKAGATDYDDIVLEQFADVGLGCSWCAEFYTSLGQMMLAPDATDDQKSYYSEILAVSGALENIQIMVDAIKNAPKKEDSDIFAESLEIAVGKDDVLKYIGEQITTADGQLKESLIAAATNHGSPLAVEMLYNETVKSGNPDQLYELGIGLGELVPDQEALPRLQELAQKRDAYSALAIKAMINQGSDGLRIVFDILSSSQNPAADRALIKDAIDHVVYADDLGPYLDSVIAKNYNPVTTEFATQIKADLELEAEEDVDQDEAEE